MKILQLGYYPPQVGGIANHLETLSKGLSKKHEITVVTYGKMNRKDKNIEIIEIPVINKTPFRGISYSLGLLKYLIKNGKNFDIIHAHGVQPAGTITSYYGKFSKAPVVITSHGSDLLKWADRFGNAYFKNVCNNSSKLICVSEYLKKKALSIGIKEEKIKIIREGLDMPKLSSKTKLRKKLKIKNNTILFVGALIDAKRPDLVVECAENSVYDFVIIGDGPLRSRLEDVSPDNVTFLGYLDHKKTLEYMKASDLVVIPSDYEGFGLVAYESLSLKTPVVSRPVAALKEMLPKEAMSENLNDKINEVMENKKLQKKIIKDFNKNKNSAKDMIKETESLYKNILDNFS